MPQPYQDFFAAQLAELGFTGPIVSEDDYLVRIHCHGSLHFAINMASGDITVADVVINERIGSENPIRWAIHWGTLCPTLIGDAGCAWDIRVPATTPEHLLLAILRAELAHQAERRASKRLLAGTA